MAFFPNWSLIICENSWLALIFFLDSNWTLFKVCFTRMVINHAINISSKNKHPKFARGIHRYTLNPCAVFKRTCLNINDRRATQAKMNCPWDCKHREKPEHCELEAPFNESGRKYVNKTCTDKLFCFNRAVPLFTTLHPFCTSGDSPPKTRVS